MFFIITQYSHDSHAYSPLLSAKQRISPFSSRPLLRRFKTFQDVFTNLFLQEFFFQDFFAGYKIRVYNVKDDLFSHDMLEVMVHQSSRESLVLNWGSKNIGCYARMPACYAIGDCIPSPTIIHVQGENQVLNNWVNLTHICSLQYY